jgi:dTDP-L-rhamnose 4-epimerase
LGGNEKDLRARMSTKKILVTGGAGFIGSHLVDDLVELGHEIIVYDNLEPQVHGNLDQPPEYLSKNITFIQQDVRNRDQLQEALQDVEVVYHLAAMVGVGQSMYQIARYIEVNTLGTANLLDILANSSHTVKKLIVASSMSTYGEGGYVCEDCGPVSPQLRTKEQMEQKDWELNCPICNKKVKPIGTNENKPQHCTSVYAYSKYDQEKLCLLTGQTYGLDTTALRFFNVYGSRQALSNPYTGVCAIFSSSLLTGKRPIIYEDGNQTRDFVHVKDIGQALILSMEKPEAAGEVFNVGTGKAISIKEVALTLAKLINPKLTPDIQEKFRPGDIRHCYADISKIESALGYKPKYTFSAGMKELVQWVKAQQGKVENKSDQANKELKQKGLL